MSLKKKPSAEQRTLNLKEQLLAEELVVTEDFLQSIIHDVGIPLDKADVDAIHKASTRSAKVRAFLTALRRNWKDDYFRRLCEVLESVDSRLTDELATELEGENGQQVITESIDLENGRIVFKEFGMEKRLSELEKKRLHSLLNRKSQCTRDIWERQKCLRVNRINHIHETLAF